MHRIPPLRSRAGRIPCPQARSYLFSRYSPVLVNLFRAGRLADVPFGGTSPGYPEVLRNNRIDASEFYFVCIEGIFLLDVLDRAATEGLPLSRIGQQPAQGSRKLLGDGICEDG